MKIFKVVLIVAIAVVGMGAFRWHRYVTNTDSPYQEVGIELNSRLPLPLRKWGCDRLHQSFAGTLPPYGCQAADGTSWL